MGPVDLNFCAAVAFLPEIQRGFPGKILAQCCKASKDIERALLLSNVVLVKNYLIMAEMIELEFIV